MTIGWNLFPDLEEAQVLFEGINYCIVATPASWMREKDVYGPLGCYSIMNKNYKTIESSGSSMPVVLRAMSVFDEEFKESLKNFTVKESQDAGNVVGIR